MSGPGAINPSTGLFTAGQTTGSVIVQVEDAASDIATLTIAVLSPLDCLCDIIKKEMQLADDQVFLWDQKFNLPKDYRPYVSVAQVSSKVFGNTNEAIVSGGNLIEHQFANVMAQVDISIMSRGSDALDRKEEVVLALRSIYAQQQMETNGFNVGILPTGFVNLSEIDGAAIPYRFTITVNMQYAFLKFKNAAYFDQFDVSVEQVEP
jgi:hypothetical protein